MLKILFFLLPIFLFGSPYPHFEREDSSLYHNIDMISGQLRLIFQDATMKGPSPQPIYRIYNSNGALRAKETYPKKVIERCRGSDAMFTGGWSFLSHTRLYLDQDPRFVGFNPNTGVILSNYHDYLYFTDRNGQLIYFKCTKNHRFGRCKPNACNLANVNTKNLSSRHNPLNSKIEIDKKSGDVKILTPDGGVKVYKGWKKSVKKRKSPLRLESEILPNRHRILYTYNNKSKDRLVRIDLQNPSGDKTFSTIELYKKNLGQHEELYLSTQDKKSLAYKMTDDLKLDKTLSSFQNTENYFYKPSRKGCGSRLTTFKFGKIQKINVTYQEPKSKKQDELWDKYPEEVPFCADKVLTLSYPDPQTGVSTPFASFEYDTEYTEVKEIASGAKIQYHHDGRRITSIEHFDEKGNLVTKTLGKWKSGRLQQRIFQNGKGEPLHTKTYEYNKKGDIIKEEFEDVKNGNTVLVRSFVYCPSNHLVWDETNGQLTQRYEYLSSLDPFTNTWTRTDLVKNIITVLNGKRIKRTFHNYNRDHLLIATIVDDGSQYKAEELEGVTQRTITRYDHHPETGLVTKKQESYLDLETGQEKIYLTSHYTYGSNSEVIKEDVEYDGGSYTLYKEYDEADHLIFETTPLGRENRSTYNEDGNLLSTKKVGELTTHYAYDFSNRPKTKTCGKNTDTSIYDIRGCLIEQIDQYGNTIKQDYDCFGNSIKTYLPDAIDHHGKIYTPTIENTYDEMGYPITTTNGKGEVTTTSYNSLHKPTLTIHPDHSQTKHTYAANGNLEETIDPDGVITRYTYDHYDRILSKKILSPEGEELIEESFTYNAFHLLSHTDQLGVTTYYSYDGLGRKIREQVGEKITTYEYDGLGFLRKISCQGASKMTIHNVEGEVIEQWEEDEQGNVENRMQFFYDEEGRKIKALRGTSVGIAEDLFSYDDEGRLAQHTDPLGAITRLEYPIVTNELGQKVQQKIIIDPLGNLAIETQDANGHLASLEKRNPQGERVALEEYFYDRGGNKTRRVTHIYHGTQQERTYTTEWEYNSLGKITKETEQGDRETHFSYDPCGRLLEKTLPTGITLSYTYDYLGRMLRVKSSDGTLDSTYEYEKGPQPIRAHDNVLNLTWERAYNLYGDLTKETKPDGLTTCWDYDHQGRCTLFTLPDKSAIAYTYTPLHLSYVTRLDKQGEQVYEHRYAFFDANGHVCAEKLIDGNWIYTHHDMLERVHRQESPWHKEENAYGLSGLVIERNSSLFGHKALDYDPLNQLTQEGNIFYHFDSIGNPTEDLLDEYNSILCHENTLYSYDQNGSPISETDQRKTVEYKYDTLGQLIEIHFPDKKITYTYDPFGRLYTKKTLTNECSIFSSTDNWVESKVSYLYDRDTEIGTLDHTHTIQELKIVGLGLLGEIGGTVAIELNGTAYTPLHDLCGNIIALVNPYSRLIEKTYIDAFGKNLLNQPAKNPWRFQSKRQEEHLIFYGKRFYNPELGRWQTKDPAGDIDSPNLYLFVCNSPLNRLDLFGLNSQDFRMMFNIKPTFEYGYWTYQGTTYLQYDNKQILRDWVLTTKEPLKLRYSPQELEIGQANLTDHLTNYFSKEGIGVGIIATQNGIGTSFNEMKEMHASVMDKAYGNPLGIGFHTPNKGPIANQAFQGFLEACGKKTEDVMMKEAMMYQVTDAMLKASPYLYLLNAGHSRGYGITAWGFHHMDEDKLKGIQNAVICRGYAPNAAVNKKLIKDAYCSISNRDKATKPLLMLYKAYGDLETPRKTESRYDIRILKCSTPRSEWSGPAGYFGDHAFMGNTLQGALEEDMKNIYDRHGFYKHTR